MAAASNTKDHWSSEAYQNAASFVPKLATKIVQWLDPQPNDVVLDIGCGVLDANKLHPVPTQYKRAFTKAFSNAALHWILRSEETREAVFRGVRDSLVDNGTFAFEMGGLGNVAEMRAALLGAVARRVGIEKAREADPWFFPDEKWITDMLESKVGGWKVEKVEREWRPTVADKGGVEAWVKLMGANFFDAVPEVKLEATREQLPSMSADDQAFLDVLASIPQEFRKYTDEVASFVDKHVDQIAGALREVVRDTLANATWLPEQFRPAPPPPAPIITVPVSFLERIQNWVARHKILVGVIAVTSGYVAYRTYRSTASWRKKRRARRARNGGRMEVVVIAGSPALPLTRSLALDMERKGFIVFVVCNGHDDETMVQNLSRPDIRPLTLDITNPTAAGASIDSFARYLQAPHAAIPNGKRYHLQFKAVILIPSLNYTTSPIATIPPSSFADLFNTHLLQPILTIQAFLPLLTARLGPPPSANTKEQTSSITTNSSQSPTDLPSTTPKVLVFTPSIISSINPPFHAPEATVCSALTAFTEVLTAELRPLGIPVTHVQLGTFDFSGFTPAAQSRLLRENNRNVDEWPDSARHAYGKNYVSQSESAISAGRIRGLRGSSLKELHNAVFDVIDGSITSGTVRVGLGASVYGFVGRWVPRGLVAWMMGIRRVDELKEWQGNGTTGKELKLASPRSRVGSPRSVSGSSSSSSSDAEVEDGGSFVTVPTAMGHAEANVWKES
ncbi:uncharacterized protein CTHT_0059220 [Thermochaetoides thermophila DSM 1495]|uniref:DUF1776-domain-containing protein n=1 Tax=Chaetomium thermophilum (strain DSM 1495 / CBS 144.50 / IMI 039719) TaxID=759272 RepID=G0SD76_CHATD|nr:hypothetical protein CTHT_0059220 [Thermochaetoides thermophila DSM 1495]EGS19296.1 hypothetical protein CTHT_0059220 [Thermochaetoides thermophila DSM 1495]